MGPTEGQSRIYITALDEAGNPVGEKQELTHSGFEFTLDDEDDSTAVAPTNWSYSTEFTIKPYSISPKLYKLIANRRMPLTQQLAYYRYKAKGWFMRINLWLQQRGL